MPNTEDYPGTHVYPQTDAHAESDNFLQQLVEKLKRVPTPEQRTLLIRGLCGADVKFKEDLNHIFDHHQLQMHSLAFRIDNLTRDEGACSETSIKNYADELNEPNAKVKLSDTEEQQLRDLIEEYFLTQEIK